VLVGVKAFSSFRKGGVTKLYPDNLNHRSYMLVGVEEGLDVGVRVGSIEVVTEGRTVGSKVGKILDISVGFRVGRVVGKTLGTGRSPNRIH